MAAEPFRKGVIGEPRGDPSGERACLATYWEPVATNHLGRRSGLGCWIAHLRSCLRKLGGEQWRARAFGNGRSRIIRDAEYSLPYEACNFVNHGSGTACSRLVYLLRQLPPMTPSVPLP